MMIYYCTNHINEYATDIYPVIAGIPPHQNISQATLESQYDEVIATDALSDSIAGYPDKLVIDVTGTPTVREKNDSEYTKDAIVVKLAELKTYTYNLIISVAEEDKQRTLAILRPNMDAGQQTNYNVYLNWHTDVISQYFTSKTTIEAATSLTILNAIVFGTEFTTEISGKPTVTLSDYV